MKVFRNLKAWDGYRGENSRRWCWACS